MLTSYIWLTPPIIFAYVAFWLLEGGLKGKMKAITANRYIWLFVSFYLLHVIGMIYTSYVEAGLFSLQVKASLLVFPLLLVGEGPMDIKKQKQFMYVFISGAVCAGLVCLGYAVWKWIALSEFEFQYMQFCDLLHQHPSYYAMYIDMAMVFVFYLLLGKAISLIRAEKIFLYTSLAFLFFILILLQSKAGLITSSLLLVVFLIMLALRRGILQSIVVFLVLAVIYALSYHFIIGGNSRIASATQVVSGSMSAKSPESTQVRYYIWHAGWEIVKGHPIIGVGTGNADTALQLQYVKDNYTGALVHHLNAHNEYLQVAVGLGFIGLLGLLACMVLPFFKTIKEHRYVYMAFLVIIAINFLTESMLEQQAGTIFYGLFNSLLMFNFVI